MVTTHVLPSMVVLTLIALLPAVIAPLNAMAFSTLNGHNHDSNHQPNSHYTITDIYTGKSFTFSSLLALAAYLEVTAAAISWHVLSGELYHEQLIITEGGEGGKIYPLPYGDPNYPTLRSRGFVAIWADPKTAPGADDQFMPDLESCASHAGSTVEAVAESMYNRTVVNGWIFMHSFMED